MSRLQWDPFDPRELESPPDARARFLVRRVRPPFPQIGNFVSDFEDDVGDAVSAVADAAHSAFSWATAPISDVIDAMGSILVDVPGWDVVKGAVEDFAQTTVGQNFLRVVSPFLVPVLWSVPFVGPVLAPLAYALPGMAAGEPVDQAFAQYAADAGRAIGEQKFSEEFPKAVTALTAELPDVSDLPPGLSPMLVQRVKAATGFDPSDPMAFRALAAQAGLREDMAEVALDGVFRRQPNTDLQFDPVSGDELTHPKPAASADAALIRLGYRPIRNVNMRAGLAVVAANKARAVAQQAEIARLKVQAAQALASDAASVAAPASHSSAWLFAVFGVVAVGGVAAAKFGLLKGIGR